jgi:hypothetical protein
VGHLSRVPRHHQAVWRDNLFIMFRNTRNTHRDSTTGDVDTVAFALPE